MILAAIDIGSNGIRLQIIRVLKNNDLVSFKKLEYIRFPLRLGRDVFTEGLIKKETEKKFEKLMRTFKLMIDLYEVDHYIASATSAMREAKNGKEILKNVANYFDLKIDLIPGKLEAEILSKAIIPYLDNKNYVHIDVGGGSTELNIYKGKEKISSRSFQLGSVRKLNEANSKKTFDVIQKWTKKELKNFKKSITAIGTGGNINKLFKLSNQKFNNSISLTELQGMQAYVNQYSIDQRIHLLKMNPDRADVIIPASEIYIHCMKIIGADQILVPGVGLKDGLIYNLYESVNQEKLSEVNFVEMF